MPESPKPVSGTLFHSLQATSQALQPMHTEVSVKNPIRGGCSSCPDSAAGSVSAWVTSASEARNAGLPRNVFPISDLRPGLLGDAGPLLVLAHQRAARRPARAPGRPDVAGEGLDLLDVHVRVQRLV